MGVSMTLMTAGSDSKNRRQRSCSRNNRRKQERNNEQLAAMRGLGTGGAQRNLAADSSISKTRLLGAVGGS